MIKCLVGAFLVFIATQGVARAQSHTLIAHSQSESTIFEIDPVSGKILHQLKVDSSPHEGVVTPEGKTIFVSVPGSAYVSVIDAVTFREKSRIESEFFRRSPQPRPATAGGAARPPNTSASPHAVDVTDDGSKLYIGIESADIPGLVVYDINSGKVLKKIETLLTGGHFFAIQPKTGKLYYPYKEDNRVVVIDTKTDKVMKIIPVKGGPRGVDFAPNGEVWLHQDNDGSVAVVDSKTDEVVKTIQTAGKGIGRIALSPDGRFAASTHADTLDVAIIDTQTKQIATNVRVGAGTGPSSASLTILFPLFSPDGAKLYIMSPSDGDIAVIDTKSWKIAARHKALPNSFGGAIKPLSRQTTSQQR